MARSRATDVIEPGLGYMASYSTVTVGSDGEGLTGQHPPLVYLLGSEGVVDAHRRRALPQDRHARGAVTGFTRERGAEVASAGRLEEGVSSLVGDRRLLPFHDDGDRLRDYRLLVDRVRGEGWGGAFADQEPLDEDVGRVDSDLQQGGLDQVHERPRTADVEIGLGVAGEVGNGVGNEEAGVAVEVMVHLEAVLVGPAHLLQGVREYHGIPAPVGIDEPYRSRRRHQRALAQGQDWA